MEFITKNWKLIVLSGFSIWFGAILEFAYLNEASALFDVFEKFQTIIGSILAMIAAFCAAWWAWHSVQEQITTAKQINDLDEKKKILEATRCVQNELIRNHVAFKDLQQLARAVLADDTLNSKNKTLNVFLNVVSGAEPVSDEMFEKFAGPFSRGSQDAFKEAFIAHNNNKRTTKHFPILHENLRNEDLTVEIIENNKRRFERLDEDTQTCIDQCMRAIGLIAEEINKLETIIIQHPASPNNQQ